MASHVQGENTPRAFENRKLMKIFWAKRGRGGVTGRCRTLHDGIHNFYFWFQTFALFWLLFYLFWVIHQHLSFICRRFGTHCLFHLHRWCKLQHILRQNRQNVPKRRHIKFRHRIITQKKNTTFIPPPQNIIRVINSRRMGWARHEAPTEEKRDAYIVLVRKHEGKRPLEGSSLDGRMTLKRIFKKYDGRTRTEIQNNGEEKDKQLGIERDRTRDPLVWLAKRCTQLEPPDLCNLTFLFYVRFNKTS